MEQLLETAGHADILYERGTKDEERERVDFRVFVPASSGEIIEILLDVKSNEDHIKERQRPDEEGRGYHITDSRADKVMIGTGVPYKELDNHMMLHPSDIEGAAQVKISELLEIAEKLDETNKERGRQIGRTALKSRPE